MVRNFHMCNCDLYTDLLLHVLAYAHSSFFPTQSIMEYNGAAIVAMVGKNCVAIAADRRLGVQAQTVSTTFQKIFQLNDTLFVGLPGLATDVHTV